MSAIAIEWVKCIGSLFPDEDWWWEARDRKTGNTLAIVFHDPKIYVNVLASRTPWAREIPRTDEGDAA
jgi:hypothetical protein